MRKTINSNILKLIAIVSMTIDHVAWLVFPGYSTHPIAIICHILGRLAFPIMAYCIAEGYHYTHDFKKYATRLFVFALISHVPYMLQSNLFREYGALAFIPFATGEGAGRFFNQGSVLWGYLMGLLMLKVNDSTKIKNGWKMPLLILFALAAFFGDWSSVAALVVFAIGSNRGKWKTQVIWSGIFILIYALVYFFAMDKVYGIIQIGTILALPVIAMYNGQKGKNSSINKFMKWLFYVYYPLHLLVIGLLWFVK